VREHFEREALRRASPSPQQLWAERPERTEVIEDDDKLGGRRDREERGA
jgi:hypothetical protein